MGCANGLQGWWLMVKNKPFCYKLVDYEKKKITSFNLIRLHLHKKIILEMFNVHRRPPTEYFTVKSEREIDLASLIAMNFMKVFSCISPA